MANTDAVMIMLHAARDYLADNPHGFRLLDFQDRRQIDKSVVGGMQWYGELNNTRANRVERFDFHVLASTRGLTLSVKNVLNQGQVRGMLFKNGDNPVVELKPPVGLYTQREWDVIDWWGAIAPHQGVAPRTPLELAEVSKPYANIQGQWLVDMAWHCVLGWMRRDRGVQEACKTCPYQLKCIAQGSEP